MVVLLYKKYTVSQKISLKKPDEESLFSILNNSELYRSNPCIVMSSMGEPNFLWHQNNASLMFSNSTFSINSSQT